MKKIFLTLVVLSILIAPTWAKQPEVAVVKKTQLEKREMQTRSYSSRDKTLIMKAILNVLQDEGFIINNANPLLGFISAVKEFDSRDKTIDVEKEFGITKGKLSWSGVTTAVVDATANVTEFGSEIKIRVNFKRKMLNAYGSALNVEEIDNAEYYKNFFAKVDKALFLQKQKI